jgi:spore coat polysaccharide biosynthesis protein SpsF
MGSTRLPGKVLKNINGHSMLWHVVSRVRQAETVDKVIVATTENISDDPVAAFCDKAGILCFRGSEDDVLARYYQAARSIRAQTVVRLTADCPLIDPSIVDQVVTAYLGGEYDYVSNGIKRTYPDGLDTEVFSFEALDRAWHEARLMSEREHVTPYIWKNDQLFRQHQVTQETDLSALRWTVDEAEDLLFVRQIYKHLYQAGQIFLMEDVVKLLEEHPEFIGINESFETNEGYQRSLQEDRIVTSAVNNRNAGGSTDGQ